MKCVPAADLTLRNFLGVTLHTRTVESENPPASRLESSVKSTAVKPWEKKKTNKQIYNQVIPW